MYFSPVPFPLQVPCSFYKTTTSSKGLLLPVKIYSSQVHCKNCPENSGSGRACPQDHKVAAAESFRIIVQEHSPELSVRKQNFPPETGTFRPRLETGNNQAFFFRNVQLSLKLRLEIKPFNNKLLNT
jgi:hypothetical protein